MINRRPRAWSQSRGPTGAFTSVQRASLPSPAVEHSPVGARRLGDHYWQERNRSTFGLVREDMLGESFDAGGPDVMTYREIIERIARMRGRHPLIVEVPILPPRLSSWWLMLVTPVQPRVARPLVEGLRTPTVAHDQRLRKLVPLELTPFDEAARSALARREGRARQA